MSTPLARPAEPAPTKRRGGDTAEQILDCAEACFARSGYAGTTLREVAAGVGIRIPSLYNHFPNKESLYRAVLARGITPVLETLSGFVESGAESYRDPSVAIDRTMELLGQRPNLPRLIQYELLAGGDHLALLFEDWLEPTFKRGLAMLEKSPAALTWKPEQLPQLLLAFFHVLMGHFTTGPLYERLNGVNPLSAEALRRQSDFFTQMVELLITDAGGGQSVPTESEVAESDSKT